jgi:hypothetical protein
LPTVLALLLAISAPVAGQILPPQGQAPATREYPFLGLRTEQKIPGNAQSGIVVTYLFPLAPAKEMGFQIGDEVRLFADQLYVDQKAFVEALGRLNVNARVRFTVLRQGQEVKLEGRVGSREKILKAHQEQVRKDFAGKPLPAFPALSWWNVEKKAFEERPAGLDALRGKLAIVFSYDDCEHCRARRYGRMQTTSTALASTRGADQVAFLGIYFVEGQGAQGKADLLGKAAALYEATPPGFPAAAAYYPAGKATAADLDRQVLLHNHGVAIVRPDGNVGYIQIVGFPEQEFGLALTQEIQKLAGAEAPARK